MRKILCVLGLLAALNVAADQPYTTFSQPGAYKHPDAYIAFDTGYYNASMVPEYRLMFRSNMLAFNFSVGYYFNDYFSVELSLSWTDNLRKTFNTSNGVTFLGMTPAVDNTHFGQFRIANTNFDFQYHIFRYSFFRPFIGAGFGWTRERVNFLHADPTDPISVQLDTINSGNKSRLFFRPSVGFDFDLPNNFGVRFLYRYDIISRVSLNSGISALPTKPLNGGNFFSLGLFYSFYS
jgi:opacity protein-like surface antigen